MKKEDAVEGAVGKAVKNRQPRPLGNFAMIAKISLGLRKFHSHSENFAILAKLGTFAILAKLGNFARLSKFRYIAKITVLSKILHFRYLSKFSLD